MPATRMDGIDVGVGRAFGAPELRPAERVRLDTADLGDETHVEAVRLSPLPQHPATLDRKSVV